MSNQPSEAALEAAKEVIVTLQESYGIEYKGGEPVDNSDWHYWASALDAFAAQAVAAEREQIIKRLNRQIIGYIQNKHLDFETTATLKEATDIAIKIVKGE